jgi:predicted O-methyltransferase YrrM
MPSTSQKLWAEVDRYFGERLIAPNSTLEAALAANHEAELPAIDVTPLQGRFLELLVRMSNSRRVLEIGTLGGYSTICLASGLDAGGSVVTLELEPRHAEVARVNLERAGVLDRVEIQIGRAVDSLQALVDGGAAPFDFIFIDADKAGYPEYLDYSLKLSHPGTVIVADNVVREGAVVQADHPDPNVQGVRRFTEKLANEPRLRATALQTVGVKKYDGLILAVVLQ